MFELNFNFCYFADWASGGYGMSCETLLHNTEGLGRGRGMVQLVCILYLLLFVFLHLAVCYCVHIIQEADFIFSALFC